MMIVSVLHQARRLAPGLLLAGGIAVGAYVLGYLVPGLNSLVWALALGMLLVNVVPLPGGTNAGVQFAARPVLKLGVVLLGFRISVSDALALGPKVLLIVLVTIPVTFGAAMCIGHWLSLPRKLSLLVGTGSAICGASAVAAMSSVADAKEEDVGFAVATVTLFGTVSLLAIPFLSSTMLGLSAAASGVWAGASVHEVGQVVAAAAPFGAASLETATLVKLTRVALLAPCVVVVGLLLSRSSGSTGTPVPAFVLGFLGAALLRSTGSLPESLLEAVLAAEQALLTAALAALGLGLRLSNMLRLGWRPLALGLLVTLVISGLSLAMILAFGSY